MDCLYSLQYLANYALELAIRRGVNVPWDEIKETIRYLSDRIAKHKINPPTSGLGQLHSCESDKILAVESAVNNLPKMSGVFDVGWPRPCPWF